MIFGDFVGLKFPDICLIGEKKSRKNLSQETCPDRRSNPDSLRDRRACYSLRACLPAAQWWTNSSLRKPNQVVMGTGCAICFALLWISLFPARSVLCLISKKNVGPNLRFKNLR